MSTPMSQCAPSTSLVYPVVVVGGGGGSSSFWLELPRTLQSGAKVQTLEVGRPLSPLRKLTRGFVPVVGRELLSALQGEGLLPCHLVGATPQGSMAVLEAARLLATNHIHPDEVTGNAVSVTLLLAALSKGDSLATSVGRLRDTAATVLERAAFLKQLVAFAPYDVRRALASVERPILCLGSESERVASWSSQPRIWELNPHAELRILNEEHMSDIEKVKDFLLEFCRYAEGARAAS